MNKKMVAVFSVFLLAGFLALFVTGARSDVCEVCSDVENTFTVDEVALGATNTITLKGYESHGIKSLSISCELICGTKAGDYCCYDVYKNKWKCGYDYLYCSQPNENGVCVEDKNPPAVGVSATPASGISPAGGTCSVFLSQDVKATVTCNDGSETGCDTSNLLMWIDVVNPGTCPKTIEAGYFSAPYGYTSSRPYYVCAAAMDMAGNINFTDKPVQFCTNTNNPIAPYLFYDYVGGNNIGLHWVQPELNSPNFDRYELHYVKNPVKENFDVTPMNLLKTINTENYDNYFEVTGLETETKYCFRIVVFDKTAPKQRNATSESFCINTMQCNPGTETQCFTRDWVTFYSNDVNLPAVSACVPGQAMCDGGYWGACENQTGPFDEVCNNIDDDCDGFVDMQLAYSYNSFEDDYVPLRKDCLAPGECSKYVGYVQCINGQWGNDSQCSTYSEAKIEICNGADDNCDGIIDNVDGGTSIASTRCGCYGGAASSDDVCNGIDDDCNERRNATTGGNTYSGIDDIERCACSGGKHKPGDLQETCNLIDEDCNGFVDDGGTAEDKWIEKLGVFWPYFQESSCGTGTICEGGHWECNSAGNGVVCSTIGGSENLAKTETCNGVDDDCDGTVDEGCTCSPPGNWTYCGSDKGECIQGRQECGSDGKWGVVCIGQKGPQIETCNGKDDDCDGIVDNVNAGNSIVSTQCRCFNATETPIAEICNGIDDNCDGIIDNVDGGTSMASARCACYKDNKMSSVILPDQKNEICNNIDDDCNGTIDDPWKESLGKTCGFGVCAGGATVCAPTGNYTVCSTNSPYGLNDKRSVETCNGKDDDCNGVVDDVNGKRSASETQCGCYDGKPSSSEICNKIDDDCDGAVDENLLCGCYEGQSKACGSSVGECEFGRTACANGAWGKCTGGKGPVKEVCNGKDDDCNGIVDDVGGGYSVEETQCGCFGGRKPTVEKCDGIDNDCNAKVDDDVDCRCNEGEEMQCGSNVGDCTPGVKKCLGGKWGECAGGVLPKKEACNGKDDDCDGVIDDVNGGNSIGSTKCACYNNFAKPGAQPEISNGIDDDCNGVVDDGFGGEPSHCQSGIKDGDETGVDCGGSCKRMCPQPIPTSTWVLVFAVIAGVIAVFGIFLSSFWKGEKKSLFERAK